MIGAASCGGDVRYGSKFFLENRLFKRLLVCAIGKEFLRQAFRDYRLEGLRRCAGSP